MDGETVRLSHFSGNNNSAAPFEVHVLVVDENATTLKITLGILTSLNYKAEGIKHPLLALERLRKKEACFDLIVIDLHLPDIDGFELKQRVDQEFPLPIIMISVDNDERVMEKALMCGVMRYIVKPATASDFKGIWQFAVTGMRGKKPSSLIGREEDSCIEDSWSSTTHHKHLSSSSTLRKEKKIIKRKDYMAGAVTNVLWEDNNASSSSLTKKTKVVWTNDLQSRFLQAINIIGLENAVPTKILEVMKTPGLTREHVASHLQKYRLFLKRVARMFAMVMNNVTDKDVFLTGLASKYPSLMLKNIQEEFRRILKHSKIRNISNPSSYKKPNSSRLYKPSKSQYNPPNSHHSTFSGKMNPIFQLDLSSKSTSINPYGSVNYNLSKHGILYDQMPASSNYSNFNNARFDEMSQIQPNGNNGVLNTCDCGCNFLINDPNYSYLIEGEVSASSEFYRANQGLAECNVMENILVAPLHKQRQENQYQVSNEEDCYQTFGIGGNHEASHLTSHCSCFTAGIDCSDNVMEGVNSKVPNQHENQEEGSKEDTNPTGCIVETTIANGDASKQQDDQEVAGKDIDPIVESNDYFPPSDQISDQLLENMNFSEFDLETFKELEQIPQDWEDGFMESLICSTMGRY